MTERRGAWAGFHGDDGEKKTGKGSKRSGDD